MQYGETEMTITRPRTWEQKLAKLPLRDLFWLCESRIETNEAECNRICKYEMNNSDFTKQMNWAHRKVNLWHDRLAQVEKIRDMEKAI